ncbi:MAG: fibronectin type III domain-containing protein [Acidobacteriota bacterium]
MLLSRILFAGVLAGLGATAFAVQPRQESNRFDGLAIESAGTGLAIRAIPVTELPPSDPLRVGWNQFSAQYKGWTVAIDQRSGLPTLAQGAGILWLAEDAVATLQSDRERVEQLERKARAFLSEQRLLLGDWSDQLVLDTAASGRASDSLWLITFRQSVGGVPVEGARLDFHVVHGNLVAFGAERWARVTGSVTPRVDAAAAHDALMAYLQAESGSLNESGAPELILVPSDPRRARAGEWTGSRGAGLTHSLVWRFRVSVPGEASSWVADVDATYGRVLSLSDETRYERVKGGVFPISANGVGYEGTEQPNFPIPFADFTIDGTTQTASGAGLFSCTTPGSAATTRLDGPYVRISNACGPVSETALCGEDINLQIGPGTNCEIPAGASAGNTRGARTSFYQVNRNAERARYWLTDNTWVRTPVQVNVNVNNTCNASWGGQLNMYRAGGGCGNTAELQGVLVHEWGHGLDQNDGGGYDNSSESYADVVAVYDARISCVGPGFYDSGTCGNYGDTCLTCTGIRDMDFAKRQANTPATPQDFLTNRCGSGSGPCGKESHCESFVSGESLWDLAVRDLPASGLDPATAWQLADRLWMQSRKGSGGNAYNCALPSSDGCGTNSWYHKLRVADDDDGNLGNGTPHAAAIFNAFKRHNIACGNATDATNLNSSSCPVLAQPTLTTSIDSGGLRLNWSAVAGAAKYRVMRSDFGCNRSQQPIADVTAPTLTFLDTDVAENSNVSYRVMAVGSNPACESPVSTCETKALVPFKGRIEFFGSAFGCGATIGVRVLDGNAGPAPLKVSVWSDSEQTPELVTLTAIAPGSSTYEGSILAGSGLPVAGDGRLVFVAGDQLSAEYVDGNDGAGNPAISADSAVVDCAAAAPTSVRVTDLTDASVVVRWNTSEPTTGRVEWGLSTALGNTSNDNTTSGDHAASLNGLNECARYFFRVISRDSFGNETILDNNGQPFGFNVGRIPGFFRDDFESLAGWGLEGEWQINTPQGKGSSPKDPTAAFSGSKVLGHDLTGLGARPGDYERSTTQSASSPVINASGKTGVEMKFRRWLNTGLRATAAVEARVNGGSWNVVWSYIGNFFPLNESAWSFQTIDLSQYADNQSNFQVRFRQTGGNDPAGQAGWNVDRVVIRQVSDPQGESCGSCGGAPSFRGLTSAADSDPCSTGSSVSLTWDQAAAWGSGSSGTYTVYRDTVPNFTPATSNRLATGIATTSYTDATAVNGVTYYYLVRAENNEACSSGANNGGVVDNNTNYKSVTTTSSQSVPGAVSNLRIQPAVGTTVRLNWNGVAGASKYRVYRSATPNGGFAQRLEVSTITGDDLGTATDGANWFYLVRAVNACGQEGP